MQKQPKKRNNQGFTLVEMIVVVLIIGIISTGAVMSLSSINRAKANGCTEKLAQLLDQTRTDSMSRVDGAVRLVISKRENTYYGTLYVGGETEENEGTIKDEVELGDGGLTIAFWKDNKGAASTLVCEVDTSTPFTIKFKKGNGGFHFDNDGTSPEAALHFDRIVITGSNTRTIRVYEETGRYRLQ